MSNKSSQSVAVYRFKIFYGNFEESFGFHTQKEKIGVSMQ